MPAMVGYLNHWATAALPILEKVGLLLGWAEYEVDQWLWSQTRDRSVTVRALKTLKTCRVEEKNARSRGLDTL
ncbi:hypothetical protein TNCV_845991 [Trichonephila clavipes]|nr:hypothetical protein TNCV_845991 [Trichonephila clavipes]